MQIKPLILSTTLAVVAPLSAVFPAAAQEKNARPAGDPVTPTPDQNLVPVVSKEARPIVSRFNAYYRSLQTMSCTAEIELFLNDSPLEDKVFMSARAVRPDRIEVLAYDEIGAFPTSQFTSNGTDLFEYSIKRNTYMISQSGPDFDSLHERAMNRSAPNLPVEIFLALLSSEPMENLLKLSIEPGLIRLEGTEDVQGVQCDVLVVNAGGSKAWVSSEGAPRLMRYRNSEAVAMPRYLPRGAVARGLDATVSFKSWVDQNASADWTWSIPQSARRMATMHENAAEPGPEAGYSSMEIDESTDDGAIRKSVGRTPGGNTLQRAGGATSTSGSGLPSGTVVPDIRLGRIDGTTVSLSELRNGRPAMLLFWVPGGKFTQSSMGKVIQSSRALSNQVEVIPIAVGGDLKQVEAFISKYPVFAGSYLDLGGTATNRLDVGDQPGMVLITPDGVIWRNLLGPRPNLDVRMKSHVNAMMTAIREDSSKDPAGEKPSEIDPDSPAGAEGIETGASDDPDS